MGVALHMPTSYHQLKLQLLWIPPDGREGHDEFLDAYWTFFSEQTPLVDADATFSFSEVYRKAISSSWCTCTYYHTMAPKKMGPFCFLLRELQNQRRERKFACTLETVRAEAGERWKSLTEEEKAHYEFMANRYKEKQVGSLENSISSDGRSIAAKTLTGSLSPVSSWLRLTAGLLCET
ncbi:hypothetical protein MRX96_015092 [Rhipicephalus microplus]